MKHRLVLLNLLLAGLTAAAGWRLREDLRTDRIRHDQVLQAKVKPPAPPVITAVAEIKPFVGVTYGDVAQKDLFSKDRNPNVVVEPPKAVVRPPMPPLPVMFGLMGLPSGLTALMADKPDGRSRGVTVGQSVGAFKVVALDQKKVTFEWDGQKIEKNVDDLLDRVKQAPPGEPPPPINRANDTNGPAPTPKPGVKVGEGMKSCDPKDTSPAGTVADGYRKISEQTPFGPACRWVQQ